MGGCVDCGESNYNLLQNDHVQGKKKCLVARSFLNVTAIEEELAKTEIQCIKCHAKKSANDRIAECKGYSNPGLAKQVQRNRMFIMQEKRRIGACNLCGTKVLEENNETEMACFHFDHLQAPKKAAVLHLAKNSSLATIKQEIDKCRLLCASCHWLHTRKQLGF